MKVKDFKSFVSLMIVNRKYYLPEDLVYEWIIIEKLTVDEKILYRWVAKHKNGEILVPKQFNNKLLYFKLENSAKRNLFKKLGDYFDKYIT